MKILHEGTKDVTVEKIVHMDDEEWYIRRGIAADPTLGPV